MREYLDLLDIRRNACKIALRFQSTCLCCRRLALLADPVDAAVAVAVDVDTSCAVPAAVAVVRLLLNQIVDCFEFR